MRPASTPPATSRKRSRSRRTRTVQLVADASFNPTDVSASAQIQRIKGANPQAVIAWSTGAAIGTVFKAISDAGMAVPVATTDGNMTFASMRQFADILPRELYIPSPEWPETGVAGLPPAVAAAKQRFFAAFARNDPPDAASTFAWDPALLVAAALEQAGPNATAEQVRTALAGLERVCRRERHLRFQARAATRARRQQRGGDALGQGGETLDHRQPGAGNSAPIGDGIRADPAGRRPGRGDLCTRRARHLSCLPRDRRHQPCAGRLLRRRRAARLVVPEGARLAR